MAMGKRAVFARGLFRTAALAVAGLCVAAVAAAGSARVELVTKVRVGEAPRITIIADAALADAVLELEREDGQKSNRELGAIAQGESRDVELDRTVGKHHYQGRLTAKVNGEPEVTGLDFDTAVVPPLDVTLDKNKVDLDKGQLEVVLSRAVETIDVTLFGAGDVVLGTSQKNVKSVPASTPIEVSWVPVPRSDLVRIELRFTDADGFFSGIALRPWAVTIPHEQVLFAVDSAKIQPSEERKLEASRDLIRSTLAAHPDIDGVKLFVAGHTDTQGSAAHNLTLSRRRAQAIAAWFAQHGITIPIYSEGFGESALLVDTADEVDEPRNRRVDYILALEEPGIRAKGHRAAFKPVAP